MSLTSLILMVLTFVVNFVIHFAFWWIMYQLSQLWTADAWIPAGQEMDYLSKMSCISILVPAVFFSIGPMQRFLVWSEGGRVATGEWKARMERALWEICERAHLNHSDYRLYVAQSQAPNAFALGNQHIAVTAGALQYLDDRELTGIMAHEMGHLKKGHTRAGLFIIGMNWFGRIIAWVYLMMNVLCRLVLWIPFLGWLVAIVMILINLQYTLCQILLQMPANLLMYGGQRKEEYEADRYACTIGLGKELERGLMDLEVYYGERKLGFLERLYTDHPETKKRLLRIRKYNNEE